MYIYFNSRLSSGGNDQLIVRRSVSRLLFRVQRSVHFYSLWNTASRRHCVFYWPNKHRADQLIFTGRSNATWRSVAKIKMRKERRKQGKKERERERKVKEKRKKKEREREKRESWRLSQRTVSPRVCRGRTNPFAKKLSGLVNKPFSYEIYDSDWNRRILTTRNWFLISACA